MTDLKERASVIFVLTRTISLLEHIRDTPNYGSCESSQEEIAYYIRENEELLKDLKERQPQ